MAGHTEYAARLAGSIADAQFEDMDAERLFAEVLLLVLHDQGVSLLPAIDGPNQAKAAANEQTQETLANTSNSPHAAGWARVRRRAR